MGSGRRAADAHHARPDRGSERQQGRAQLARDASGAGRSRSARQRGRAAGGDRRRSVHDRSRRLPATNRRHRSTATTPIKASCAARVFSRGIAIRRRLSGGLGREQRARRRSSRRSLAADRWCCCSSWTAGRPEHPGHRASIHDGAGFRAASGGRTIINGLDGFVGTYHGRAAELGRVVVRAAHVALERDVSCFLAGIAPSDDYERAEPSFIKTINSFKPLSRQRRRGDRAQPDRSLHGARGRHLAIDCRTSGCRRREADDAGNHERPRGERPAAGRRADQDRGRRVMTTVAGRTACRKVVAGRRQPASR